MQEESLENLIKLLVQKDREYEEMSDTAFIYYGKVVRSWEAQERLFPIEYRIHRGLFQEIERISLLIKKKQEEQIIKLNKN